MGRVRFTIYHSRFTRLRTYPQHTLSLLPLLRSRPGGVHKTSVVRSPKSDNSLKHCRLSIVDCRLPLVVSEARPSGRAGLPGHALPNGRASDTRKCLNGSFAVRDDAQQTINPEMQ